MNSKSRKLIEYYGIEKCKSENLIYFKKFDVDSCFEIPYMNSCIGQITKFWASVDIINKEIIKTPKGTSLEGQNLSGYKLLVYCDLNFKFEYLDDERNNINIGYQKIPFYVDVILPETFTMHSPVKATICIEDILSSKLDYSTIYNNTSMVVVVDIC